MYGQGNYAPQTGQSANASGPQSHQWPHAPAPPPPSAQAPHPPMFPYGLQIGPQGGHRGPPTYQHGHPGLRHPSPHFPIPTSGSNSNQYYAVPPPPPPSAQLHGNTPILQSHQVPGQHVQWNSSMHHIPPVVAPGARRVLPPPPPYRGAVHEPSPDSMQGFPHNLPPPPPLPPSNLQNSGSSTPAPFDGSMPPGSRGSPVPPAAPSPRPPLPPSPPGEPPLPPSSPALKSSTAAANLLSSRPGLPHSSLTKQSIHDMSSDRSSGVDGVAFNSVDNLVSTHGAPKDEEVFEHDRGIVCTEGLPVDKNLTSDLASPPPKPVSLAFRGESSSLQLINSINSAPSHSAADSDMEMEDDITQLDEHQQIHSFGAEKQLKDSVTEDTLHQNSSFLAHLEPEEQRQDSPYRAPSSLKELSSEVTGLNRGNDALLNDHVQPSSSPGEDVSNPRALPTDKGVALENVRSQLMAGASPFRLIQGYASDDSLDNDNCIEDVGPMKVPLPSEVVTTISKTKAERSPISSVKPSNSVAKYDKKSSAPVKIEGSIDDSYGSQVSVKRDTVPEGSHQESISGVDVNDSLDFCKEDAKDESATQNVDEFGRLVRKGIRESDSDDSPRYKRRHRKRGRSRSRSLSRSRSPHDRRRRRSPRKRTERRGRSRSISPKRRRSRSKSPSRHGLTSGGDKMRRDRGHPPQCFDFLRGRCHRGTSCRYFHAEPDKSDKSRSYRSKHHDQDLPPISKDSDKQYSKELDDFKDFGTNKKFENTRKESVYKGEKSKSQDIPDMEVKDMKESDPISHLYGKENKMDRTASPVIVTEMESDAAGSMPSSAGTMVIHLAKDHVSDRTILNADDKLVGKCDLSVPLSSSVQTSLMVSPVQPAYLSASFSSLPPASSIAFAQQMPSDQNLPLPFSSAYTEKIPSYQAPFPHQQSPFTVPLSSSWNSLPPRQGPSQPPHSPFVNESSGNAAGGQHSVPGVHFQQNIGVVPRNDYISHTSVRPYASTLPSIPQIGEHHAYVQTQPNYTRGSPASRPSAFLGERLPLGDLPGPPKSYTYMQMCGVSSSGPMYTSDLLDHNQAPRLPDFGGSRISSHFNPYASTFDQPLTTNFSSGQIHERDVLPSNAYSSSFSLSNMPIDGRPEGLGSRNITPSAHAAEAMFPQPGGNQYDPLYDSIEPSTNSLKKSDPVQKREVTDESGAMLRLSGSNEPLDMEVNKSRKGGASSENDEYGDTAEAEVGAVENGSLSDSSDGEDNIPSGEIEIEQVKPSGEKKKSKDSRSMKLFKIAVADFVKELLKPSWRQGNMSKEVFKTIVRKTVDKVSGAMKSRHPKSKAKIDHYIDSSQRKLTKLVMGYVDKYVKA